jgi:hypothetical protein
MLIVNNNFISIPSTFLEIPTINAKNWAILSSLIQSFTFKAYGYAIPS